MKGVNEFFNRLTYLLTGSTFVLILLGGYVKAISAGLACPDWPLCYGRFFPFFDDSIDTIYTDKQIFAEWFHRLWAALVGLLLIYVFLKAIKIRQSEPRIFQITFIIFILFGAQVLLGWWTVTGSLHPVIVVFHLGNAVAIIIMEMLLSFSAFLALKMYRMNNSAATRQEVESMEKSQIVKVESQQ